MVWCHSPEEGVRDARANSRTMFVYVEDIDDPAMQLIVDNPVVRMLLNSTTFVGLRVAHNSELYQQINDLYRCVPPSCLFFINPDGIPLDLILNTLEVDDAINRINILVDHRNAGLRSRRAVERGGRNAYFCLREEGTSNVRPARNPTPARREVRTRSSRSRRLDNTSGRQKRKKIDVRSSSSRNDSSVREPSRKRKGGSTHHVETRPSRHVRPPPPPPLARIQFRLPDGMTHTYEFPLETTVFGLFQYVASNVDLPFRHWGLATSFPRYEFTRKDNGRTLSEVGLVPNGVVLIIPVIGQISQQSMLDLAGQILYSVVTTPLTAVYSVWSFITSMMFGNDDSSSARSRGYDGHFTTRHYSSRVLDEDVEMEQESDNISQPSETAESRQHGRRTRRVRSSTARTFLRDGNVHRFTFHPDDEDKDNNTWNGNSTQQM